MKVSAAIGKERRMRRLFSNRSGRIVLVPLDDSLLAGPILGLENVRSKLQLILQDSPDALIGFKGLFLNHSDLLISTPGILNVTASTTRSHHTKKTLIASVEEALRLGLEAVAVHVNITSAFESEMLSILGSISRECELLGMPLLAQMYARSEKRGHDDNHEQLKRKDRDAYAELVAHAGRVGVEAGADIIKTQYTGDADSFEKVIEACAPIPVVVAGGPPVTPAKMLQSASAAISAGARGICFGRNVFSRPNPSAFIAALKAIVHEGASAESILKKNFH